MGKSKAVALLAACVALAAGVTGSFHDLLTWAALQRYPAEDVALVRSVIVTSPGMLGARPAAKADDAGYAGYILYESDFRNDPGVACKLRAANSSPLVLVDQEGGPVVRIRDAGAVPLAPFGVDRVVSAEAYRVHAAAVGRELRDRHCIDVNLAPVVEPGTHERSASLDLPTAARYADAFAAGMLAACVAPTLKHFPGRTLNVTYERVEARPGWPWTESRSVATDGNGLTVRQAAAHFRPLPGSWVMLANNTYPEVAANPAVMEPVFGRWLRDDAGFRGIVVTDELAELYVTRELAVGALRNSDLLLASNTALALVEGHLLDALADGEVTRADLESRRARVLAAKAWLRGGCNPGDPALP